MIPITDSTCERAWLQAAEALSEADENTIYNLVLEVGTPAARTPIDLAIRKAVDQFLRSRGANPISTVAGTIFPTSEYLNHGPRGVYEVYPNEVYPEILSDGKDWGRYAYRLVHWPQSASNGENINPLELVIKKIRQQFRPGGPHMHACYELSLTDTGIDLPLYDPLLDARRPRNGPCLSHVSLKVGRENELYLTALYRSHSYIARAMGNLIGLAALQAFICEQTDLNPGPLVCVSTYARLERGEKTSPWTIADAKELVRSARAAAEGLQHGSR